MDGAVPPPPPPPPPAAEGSSEFRHLDEIGPGFWNLRGSFLLAKGLIDVGNHMSFLRLPSGSILVVDALATYSKNPKVAEEVQREVDVLTNRGRWIEAAVFTHPFHTGGIAGFHRAYPDVPLYGAPRHLKMFPDLPWKGELTDEAVRNRWEPAVSMRIPAGTEFVKPVPPASNHLSTCLVYHRESRAMHADDFFMYFDNIWSKMGKAAWVVLKALKVKDGDLRFHTSMLKSGLKTSPDNPAKMAADVKDMMCQWDVEHLCTAHTAVLKGRARERILELLESQKPALEKLAAKLAKKEGMDEEETSHMWGSYENETECG